MVALDSTGKRLWQVPLRERDAHIDAAAVAPAGKWVAVLLRGGRVVVIDTANGAIVAESSGEAARGDVAWLATKEAPLLVVTSAAGLNAYNITAQ